MFFVATDQILQRKKFDFFNDSYLPDLIKLIKLSFTYEVKIRYFSLIFGKRTDLYQCGMDKCSVIVSILMQIRIGVSILMRNWIIVSIFMRTRKIFSISIRIRNKVPILDHIIDLDTDADQSFHLGTDPDQSFNHDADPD
jgi:hypothetical protein